MMNIKTGFEILSDLINRGYYNVVYVEQNFPLPFKPKGLNPQIGVNESYDIIISSAIAGNNALGIYHSNISPRFNVELRGVAVFITTVLPNDPQVPVIFCRDINQLFERFNLAIKISEDYKIPVIYCINGNALNNFIEISSLEYSVERILPHIAKDTFKRLDTNHTIKFYYKIFDNLIAYFKNVYDKEGELTFKNSKGKFLNFYIPFVMQFGILNDSIDVDEDDLHFWESITKYNYPDLKINTFKKEFNRNLRDIFCPGCPFLLISRNINLENKILITDINCPTIRRSLGFINEKIENIIGMTMNKPSPEIIFIGNLSNINQNMLSFIKNFNYIFLNNGVKFNFGLPSISKPYRFKEINSVFPYSCNNIERNSCLKINSKKCVCFKKNEEPHCIRGSHCPALFENNGSMFINDNLCVGCRLCELSCPYGAIK